MPLDRVSKKEVLFFYNTESLIIFILCDFAVGEIFFIISEWWVTAGENFGPSGSCIDKRESVAE